MHCRDFHRRHSDLLDGTLPALEIVRIQRHIAECARCADHDASVRRALLVFKNLPAIEPSREFSSRLNKKLAHVRLQPRKNPSRVPMYGSIALAAGLALTVGMAATTRSPGTHLTLAPAVASQPQATASQFMAPAIAASMTAGFPAWPAALMVERASQQLADAELHFSNYTPR